MKHAKAPTIRQIALEYLGIGDIDRRQAINVSHTSIRKALEAAYDAGEGRILVVGEIKGNIQM